MTEKTAKKARDIIDKLEQHRMFLKEYDKCSSKNDCSEKRLSF